MRQLAVSSRGNNMNNLLHLVLPCPAAKEAPSRGVACRRILCNVVLYESSVYPVRVHKRSEPLHQRWMQERPRQGSPSVRPGLGRVRFPPRLEEIRVAVEQGYPLRVIYEAQHEAVAINYSPFVRYVAQFVRQKARAKLPGMWGKPRRCLLHPPRQGKQSPILIRRKAESDDLLEGNIANGAQSSRH